jgi:DNA-directed RNA polymerase subunit RPC12/RpoP
MTVTLQCLDCGFQFTVTLPRPEESGAVAESISCGHCRCRRWAPAA